MKIVIFFHFKSLNSLSFDIVLAQARLTLQKKNKPKNDIDIRKVPMLVHLFPKYLKLLFLVQSVEAFEQDGRRNGQI